MIREVAPLSEILNLNTSLFFNSLKHVDDSLAQTRLGGVGNNMAFIALHLLDARCYMARYVGLDYTHPFEGLEEVNSIADMREYPPVQGMLDSWRAVSAQLMEGLPEVTEEYLGQKSSVEFPVDDSTVLGGLAFLLQHESFHIGQLAFLRRQLGLDPMAYT